MHVIPASSVPTVTLLHQLAQQPAPLLPEQVGPRQAAVPADHAQVGDAALHQVVSRLQATLVGAELFAAGAADNGPALTVTQAELSLTSTDATQKRLRGVAHHL